MAPTRSQQLLFPPYILALSENFVLVGKCFSDNTKFGARSAPNLGDCKDKIKILTTHISSIGNLLQFFC